MKRLLLSGLLALLAGPALGQSSAQPVVPGYLTGAGCPPNVTTCFVQYGASQPIGGTVTTQPAPFTSAALAASSVTSGTPVTVATAANDAKGGWIKNCNASGTLYVNDVGTAGTSEGTNNAALTPGTGGAGQSFNIAPGTTVTVNASTGTLNVCGEQYK